MSASALPSIDTHGNANAAPLIAAASSISAVDAHQRLAHPCLGRGRGRAGRRWPRHRRRGRVDSGRPSTVQIAAPAEQPAVAASDTVTSPGTRPDAPDAAVKSVSLSAVVPARRGIADLTSSPLAANSAIVNSTASLGRLPDHPDAWRWTPYAVDGRRRRGGAPAVPAPDAGRRGGLAQAPSSAGWLTLLDKPLHRIQHRRGLPVVDYAKTHHRRMLVPEHWPRAPELPAGERSGLPPGRRPLGPRADIARIEMPSGIGRDAPVAAADRPPGRLPGFALGLHRYARAPVNLMHNRGPPTGSAPICRGTHASPSAPCVSRCSNATAKDGRHDRRGRPHRCPCP